MYSFFNLGARWDGCQRHSPAILPPGNRPGTPYIGSWVGPTTGLDGCGKFRPTGIRSPDRPACSESLYQLSYPGPAVNYKHFSISKYDSKELWTVPVFYSISASPGRTEGNHERPQSGWAVAVRNSNLVLLRYYAETLRFQPTSSGFFFWCFVC
jgi:hypothetical protein